MSDDDLMRMRSGRSPTSRAWTFDAIHKRRPMVSAARAGRLRQVRWLRDVPMLDIALSQGAQRRWRAQDLLGAFAIPTASPRRPSLRPSRLDPDDVCPIKWDAPIVGLMRCDHRDGVTTIEVEFFLSMDRPRISLQDAVPRDDRHLINEAQFLDTSAFQRGRPPGCKAGAHPIRQGRRPGPGTA